MTRVVPLFFFTCLRSKLKGTSCRTPKESWRAPRRMPKYGGTRNPRSELDLRCAARRVVSASCHDDPRLTAQGRGDQEEGRPEDRRAADEAGSAGHRSWRKQANCARHVKAQLSRPSHLCGLVSNFLFIYFFINKAFFHSLRAPSLLTLVLLTRCKKWGIPVEKIYNKTQREKFAWAIDMADDDFEFWILNSRLWF